MDPVDTDLEAFRSSARQWLADHMPRQAGRRLLGSDPYGGSLSDDAKVERARFLQRTLFEGGFAGLVFPVEYGGRGLTPAHQRVFAEECAGYELPLWLNMSTLAIIAPTLLDFGTEEQKRRYIPAILRGDAFWAQLLSEPTGGSDLAAAVTRADRDGDVWILNGSKIWTSGGHLRDYGMCLARTSWDVPKHQGLSMFVVDLNAPGVHIQPIRQVGGNAEFCQEFFEDVVLPADALVGELNGGWTVASRMLIHERRAVGGASPYAGGPRGATGGERAGGPARDLVTLAQQLGRSGDSSVRRLVAEAHVLATVRRQLVRRISTGVARKALPEPTASLLKLMTSTSSVRISTIGYEIAGAGAVVADEEASTARWGTQFIARQTICLGGGTNEMQRNMIAERVLGMPRESADDRERPFREVRTNVMPSRKR